MLVRARASVNVQNKEGASPLEIAIDGQASDDCVEFLLECGAKVPPNLRKPPSWFTAMLARRKRCRDAAFTVYSVLRKRWRLEDGTRVPRDMINVLTKAVWDSRRDERWKENT